MKRGVSMIDNFKEAMQQAGIAPPNNIQVDGTLHRFHVEGDKPRSENGWYVLHDDPLAGAFGSWKHNISETWFSKTYTTLTDEEKARYRANMEVEKRQREAEQRRIHAECREQAAAIWSKAKPAAEDHPYLFRKQIKPYTIRQYGKALVVPLRDGSGTLHGLQFINSDGSKKFLTGTAKAGNYFAIGGKPETVLYLAEGYATAATIHEATGEPVAICFDAGNLNHVAEVLRSKFPDMKIVICADDDKDRDDNPGLTKGTEAAVAIGGLLAVPKFPEGVTGTDFNDLVAVVGLDEVKRQIEAAAEPKQNLVKTLSTFKPTDNEKYWEEPLLFGEIDTPEIPASILPSWLGRYAGAVAATIQTPEGMAVMLALSTAATCLQKRFNISPYGSDYREPINLWTVTALPPASRKTAVIEALTEPLLVWEREQAEQMVDEIRQVKTKREVRLARIAKLTKKAANEDDTQQRQALLYDIGEVEKDMPEEIRPPRLWTGDVTPERLQGLLVEHGERMALLSDEAGIFEIMAGLYSDGKVNLDVFLQAHAGKSVRVDRTSRAAHLEAPALTFGLAVQPAIIADLSQGSKKKFRGNGSLARFLYCLPQNNIGKRNVRCRYSIPLSIKAEYHAGIVGLLRIDPELDQDGREHPRQLILDAEALECWLAFSEFIESKQGTNGEYESIQDWTGKLPGAALRIAGIFHVVEYGLATMTVNQSTMAKALDLAALLIEHAKAAFDLMAADQITDDSKAILQWITGNELDQFTRTEVRKAFKSRWTKAERLNKALEDLQNRDIIGESFKGETSGRYAVTYPVNPYLFGGVAA